jgi:hypothetical protein
MTPADDRADAPPTSLRDRIAAALRDNLKRRTIVSSDPIAGGVRLGLTEYDLADVVMTVLDAEQRDAACAGVDAETPAKETSR